MIATELKHIERQAEMTGALRKAVDFLRARAIQDLADGRFELEGDRVFALVQRYKTAAFAEPKFEAHRKYLDVQYIVTGEESIGWAPSELISITEPYDADKDICFGTVRAGHWTSLCLPAGGLALFWPEDGHAPKLARGVPSSVMKVVVKIAL